MINYLLICFEVVEVNPNNLSVGRTSVDQCNSTDSRIQSTLRGTSTGKEERVNEFQATARIQDY